MARTLALIEKERKGDFTITYDSPKWLDIISTSPAYTAFAKDAAPDQFRFGINYKHNEKTGSFQVDSRDITSLFTEIRLESGEFMISLWVVFCHRVPKVTFELPVPLLAGHRGCGSERSGSDKVENTFESLATAAKRGAQFVEFDVQLAKDHVPMIHHDFVVSKAEDKPVWEQTSAELTALGLAKFEDFFGLPTALGFDIEVKYPCDVKWEGKVETADRNLLIGETIAMCEAHAGSRHIFYSSFDVPVTVMLQLAQSRPVYLLVEKDEEREIDDLVMKLTKYTALMRAIGVSGWVTHSVEALKYPEVVSGLSPLLTWGKESSEVEGIKRQLEMGVAGFITDKLPIAREALGM
jgi:glycerophosphoryl diester phosphodiesterase